MKGMRNDVRVLTALYFGNHLTQSEIKRAYELVYALNKGLKERKK